MKQRSSDYSKNSSNSKEKIITKAEAYQKACHFCAYQERTQQEVREKLKDLNLPMEEAEELISRLIVENYINEERFAKTYAGGKFRVKKWGRLKIQRELKLKRLSDYCIRKGLLEIDDEEYSKVLEELIDEKNRSITEKNPFKRNHKLALFLIAKGFEPELVWDKLREEK